MARDAGDLDDLRALFELSTDMLCIANLDGFFIRVNPAWTRTLGHSEKDLLSRPFVDFVHPDDVQKTLDETRALTKDSHKTVFFQNRYRKSDNSSIWLTWSAHRHQGKIYGIAKDITSIKENEDLLASIQGQAKIGGWKLDISDFTTKWTDETYRIHDLPLNTPTDVAKGIEFYHPDYRAKISKYVKDCIEQKRPYDDIFKFITAKNRQIWVRVTGYPVVDHSGKVTHLNGTFQDVNSLKALTDELAKATAQFSDVLTNSPGMVYQFQMNPDGTMFFPYSSPQAYEIYEIEAEQFKKDPSLMLNMAHPEDQADLQKSIVSSATTLKPFEWNGRIISASGKIKWIKARSIPRKLDSGCILWNGIVVDITKEKELEKSLFEQRRIAEHTARLASLGELAAGVGHEINNPLAIVMGHLAKLNRDLGSLGVTHGPLRLTISKIESGCERIKKIVVGLKSLVHTKQTALSGETSLNNQMESADLLEALSGTLDLVYEIYAKEGIKITTPQKGGMMIVHCSSTHIQQIVMNLLANAKDACLQSTHPQIQVTVHDSVNYWTVSVADNGKGISPSDQEKLFSAFFTTKAVGKGTGLGLAISKSIIESYGGKISFESSLEGTVFHVNFPKSEQTPTAHHPIEFAAQDLSHEQLSVLVVDDEREICDILSDALRHHNCHVTSAENAQTAIEIIKQKSFDLIITDVKMPGMNGISLLTEIAAKNLAAGTTKIILTGGMVEEIKAAIRRSPKGTFDGILSKPFTPKELLQILQLADQKKRTA